MKLAERFDMLEDVFIELENTNSRLEKEDIINNIPKELIADFKYCLEIICGRRKIGYTYEESNIYNIDDDIESISVSQYIEQCFINSKTESEKAKAEFNTGKYGEYVEPIVNRRWKLGIGSSLFEKEIYSPMLAKKFDGTFRSLTYTLTEKLDGNRCIAYYENGWHYKSRNGKDMNVEFDMSGLDTRYIYDGEVLSPLQVEMSNEIYQAVRLNRKAQTSFDSSFNSTSGLINRKSKTKDLVYNIFDVVVPAIYSVRRCILSKIQDTSNVRVLPIIGSVTPNNLDELFETLDIVTSIGGEGIMLNANNALYQNKRTYDLLKLKKSYTMDMKVTGIELGTGKYQGMIGALDCKAEVDGKIINCKVGTGFTDAERANWAVYNSMIVGKIVEIEYFSLSQDKEWKGTNIYSLRFPRFKKVRFDKDNTSID